MKEHAIIQDYYGSCSFIELNKDKDITIFLVDDNKVYLKLLKLALKRKNFTILTFTTGEECLDYLEAKPDLVILDYHLDGVNPKALKGDKIAELIHQQLPDTETIIISADEKFHFISNINISDKVIFKDEEVFPKLRKSVSSMVMNIKTQRTLNKKAKGFNLTVILLIVVPSIIIYLFLTLL